MDLIINHAILHVLNRNETHFSKEELDIDSDLCYSFISKNVKKILGDAAAKEAVFNDGSEIYEIIQNYMNSGINFKEFSESIAEKLSAIIRDNEEVSPADALIVQFDIKGNGHLAVIKINYKECFTHQIGQKDDGADNQLVNIPSLNSAKIEHACIIPYEPMVLHVLEKPCEIGGEMKNYFSEIFLQCGAEMSKKEAVQIINETAEEINCKYFNDSVETEAKLKIALLEESIDEDGTISIQSIASKAFSENEEAQEEFVEIAKDAGLIKDVHLGEKYIKQQFSQQKFKSENGIELKFPAGLSDDKSIIEFIQNDDGTLSIMLKNLRRA